MKKKFVAEGRTAEIFAWGSKHILKLVKPGFPPDMAAFEADCVRTVLASGLKIPAVVDEVGVDGRFGIVYERVNGPTMLQALMAEPGKLSEYARLLAELHADLHTRSATALPVLKDRLRQKILRAAPLPDDWKTAVLANLETLPDGSFILHGDFHPDNIILTVDGPVIIDWIDVTQGHPLADVARTRLLLLFGGLPPGIDRAAQRQIASMRQQFWTVYEVRYREIRPFSDQDLATWELPVAAARLDEGIQEQEQVLLRAIQKLLAD
jgi:uncharacterized protein (TIGR02172 family)